MASIVKRKNSKFYTACYTILLDDLGYVPFSKTGAELFMTWVPIGEALAKGQKKPD